MKLRQEKASYYSTQLEGNQLDYKETWKILSDVLPKGVIQSEGKEVHRNENEKDEDLEIWIHDKS